MAFTVEWQSAGDFDNEDYGFEDGSFVLHQTPGTPPGTIPQNFATPTID